MSVVRIPRHHPHVVHLPSLRPVYAPRPKATKPQHHVRPAHVARAPYALGMFGTGSRAATPILSMSDRTWKSSVGKYMELSFYDVTTVSQLETCGHTLYRNHHRFFALQDMVVRFAWEPVQRYEISLPPIVLQVRFRARQSPPVHPTHRHDRDRSNCAFGPEVRPGPLAAQPL